MQGKGNLTFALLCFLRAQGPSASSKKPSLEHPLDFLPPKDWTLSPVSRLPHLRYFLDGGVTTCFLKVKSTSFRNVPKLCLALFYLSQSWLSILALDVSTTPDLLSSVDAPFPTVLLFLYHLFLYHHDVPASLLL